MIMIHCIACSAYVIFKQNYCTKRLYSVRLSHTMLGISLVISGFGGIALGSTPPAATPPAATPLLPLPLLLPSPIPFQVLIERL